MHQISKECTVISAFMNFAAVKDSSAGRDSCRPLGRILGHKQTGLTWHPLGSKSDTFAAAQSAPPLCIVFARQFLPVMTDLHEDIKANLSEVPRLCHRRGF